MRHTRTKRPRLCQYCKKPVLAGQSRHTPSGDHAFCRENAAETWRDNFDHESRSPTLARANGGHLAHWVIPSTSTALCGHRPKQNSWRMKTRGRWVYIFDLGHLKMCGRCSVNKEKHDAGHRSYF